jgi:hypothetical protein
VSSPAAPLARAELLEISQNYDRAVDPNAKISLGLKVIEKATQLPKKKGAKPLPDPEVAQATTVVTQHVPEEATKLAVRLKASADELRRVSSLAGPPMPFINAATALDAYAAKLNQVANQSTSSPSVSSSDVESARAKAIASVAVSKEAADEAAAAADEAAAAAQEALVRAEATPTQFGEAAITMPTQATVRQFIVDVKIVHSSQSKCIDSGNAGATADDESTSCDDTESIGSAGRGQAPDDAGAPIDPRTTHTLVYFTVSHGNYYYDVGLVTALVPDGQRNISTPQLPGIPGAHSITVTSQTATVTGVALNLYPGGHRRDFYSGFEGETSQWDMFGLQVAINPDLKNPQSTIFGGLIFEPVTGVALSGGAIFLQGDFLRSGYYEGMSTSAPRSDYVVQKTMARAYFGVTFSYELLHTTAARLQDVSSGN